ncbi:MAG: DNA-binding protein [Clostridia bacterium]|nr:DNA-binding protein [Clostridia bacterium]
MDEKRFEISVLLDIYAPLLSDRHKELLDLYYNEDLSLSEIAESAGITRQGVRDAIKHGESDLYFFEKGLRFAEKSERLKALSTEISAKASEGDLEAVKELAERLSAEVQ